MPVGSVRVCVCDPGTDKAKVKNTRGLGSEWRVKAAGPLCAITQRSCLFIAHFVIKLLSHFEPPNRLLRARDIYLSTAAVTLVNSASACVRTLRPEKKVIFWKVTYLRSFRRATKAVPVALNAPGPSRRRRTTNKNRVDEAVQLWETPPPAVLTGPGEDNLSLLKVRSKFECACVRACVRACVCYDKGNVQYIPVLAALKCTRRGAYSVWAASGDTCDVVFWMLLHASVQFVALNYKAWCCRL